MWSYAGPGAATPAAAWWPHTPRAPYHASLAPLSSLAPPAPQAMSTLVYVCIAAPPGSERIVSSHMTAGDLAAYFGAFGVVDDVLVMYRHAVVMFADPDGAYCAITHGHGHGHGQHVVNNVVVLARQYVMRPTTDAAYYRIMRHCERVQTRVQTRVQLAMVAKACADPWAGAAPHPLGEFRPEFRPEDQPDWHSDEHPDDDNYDNYDNDENNENNENDENDMTDSTDSLDIIARLPDTLF